MEGAPTNRAEGRPPGGRREFFHFGQDSGRESRGNNRGKHPRASFIFWDRVGQKWSARELQAIENMVELVGIEPTTSSLRTMLSPAHLASSFNHIEELEAGNGSIFWNVFGTCGS